MLNFKVMNSSREIIIKAHITNLPFHFLSLLRKSKLINYLTFYSLLILYNKLIQCIEKQILNYDIYYICN